MRCDDVGDIDRTKQVRYSLASQLLDHLARSDLAEERPDDG
jgi:hypothetical protein